METSQPCDFTWLLYVPEEAAVCLDSTQCMFQVLVLFSICRTSVITFTYRRIEYLIHWYGIWYDIALDQMTHFTGKEVYQETQNHRIYWLYYLLHYPKAFNMKEWWNDILKVNTRGNNSEMFLCECRVLSFREN